MSEIINDRNWNLLLNAIEQERVVPIIGSDFFYVYDKGTQTNSCVKDYVLSKLSQRFDIHEGNLEFSSIADYIEKNYNRYSSLGKQTDIYYEIETIVRNTRIKCNRNIVDFLSINKFPLICTTSVIPGLEADLKAQFGDIDIQVYKKSVLPDLGDSPGVSRPTLYYLFGKCNRINKSFMVTEDDLVDYLHYWHNRETRPTRISNYLSNKFLLVLGCNFPNWFFRFFWHSIRNFTLTPRNNEMQGVVTLEDISKDQELAKFLAHIQTQIYENGDKFIEEFLSRWDQKEIPSQKQENDEIDIFISYAKEDVDIVRNIAERLRNLGAEVWLDENKLEWSDLYESIIEEKITKAKRFVPIISQTTIKPGRRFFRREWTMAIREMDYRLGMPFFAPIVIDETNVNNALIPEPFRKAHIISLSNVDFDVEMKKLIRSFR